MKTFDWILLGIAAPWILLNMSVLAWAIFSPKITSLELRGAFFYPFVLILFILWRVYG